MRRTAGTFAAIAAVTLVVAACGGDDSSTTTLNDGADAVEVSPDTGPADAGEPGSADDDHDDAGQGGDDAADDTAGAADAERDDTGGSAVIDPRADYPVPAQPGRWAIGEAGFVEFDVRDRELVLVDVEAVDGWRSSVDEDSSDEIEVDFKQGNVDIDVEIELDDGRLEIDVDTDIDRADPGVYELGQAGSMEFTVDNGRLVLRDVVVADGWSLRMDEEDSDEIEFTLSSGNERWRVEIELDDGAVELEIDYRVRDTI
ncbi:hypothetical protein [Phytoactinopolyspora limicola]|uniref:hypothetical protein n=1 Tax=Phytoactinopolyspora limicola TaxID=2715536 RepID=UPI00140CF4D7|nr:hypothetical protein [Phytoactinopolyspora limicola]